MTEEEFKRFMKKIVLLVIAITLIVIVMGFVVFNKFGKETSIFSSQAEIDSYKKKVQEANSREITEKDLEKLEKSEEFEENEKTSETKEETTKTNEQAEQQESHEEVTVEEQPEE